MTQRRTEREGEGEERERDSDRRVEFYFLVCVKEKRYWLHMN